VAKNEGWSLCYFSCRGSDTVTASSALHSRFCRDGVRVTQIMPLVDGARSRGAILIA
jgi:hypothetical protein